MLSTGSPSLWPCWENHDDDHKFLAHGTGSAAAAEYLTRERFPAQDQEKSPEEVKILRGNPHQVASVAGRHRRSIDCLKSTAVIPSPFWRHYYHNIVLAAILKFYIYPFILFMTLPLGLIGVILSLIISGKTINIISINGNGDACRHRY